MTTYNTYQEAKIANPKYDIYEMAGHFAASSFIETANSRASWNKCNPADHCMTVEKFLADGCKFVNGDLIIGIKGTVEVLTNRVWELFCADANKKRLVLRAAALEENEPELTKDDSPQGILSAISNRLHNVGCEHQNLAFGHELSGMACDIWGVLPLISNESIQGKKPRTEVEYVKCEFDSAWEAVKDFEDGKKLYTKRSHKDYILIDSAPDVLRFLYDLHKRIETEIDERNAFVDALNDLFHSHTMSTSDLFNAIVDSGKFKLVN
jgi:hypothetical protein